MPQNAHTPAIRHLKRADARLAKVIDAVGPCRMQPHRDGEHFHALLRAIVYQQLSGKAAATIHARILALFDDGLPRPEQFATVPDEALRGAGLSKQKIRYVRDLADKTASGALLLHTMDKLGDAEIERALTGVMGVGRWTAQMFLLFRLGRPDVLPETDLGIRKGVMKAYRLRSLPSPERVRVIGACWSPYSSVASWYLWRILEVDD
jgi:DNA-3-methyladenine glycosylase II